MATRTVPVSAEALAKERFVSVTTFKRDGTPVSVPVWCAGENGTLLVFSEANSWKVKRIRRDPHVRVTSCNARGAPHGPAVDAEATIVEDTSAVEALLAQKYRRVWSAYMRVMASVRWLRHQRKPASMTIRITPRRDDSASPMPNDSAPGDGSRILPLLDAVRLLGVVLIGVWSRRSVRPRGDEARRPLPGDELLPGAQGRWTHGVTIRARAPEIWPWLVQMGCRRAGWYSYDGLDNRGIRSAQRVVPELQRVEIGDVFPWTVAAEDGFVVQAFEPERALVLGGDAGSRYRVTWAFVLEPVDEDRTRLITRVSGRIRAPPGRADAEADLAPDRFRHAATATAQPETTPRGGGIDR